MFATVEICKGEKTLKGKIREFFGKARMYSEKVELEDGEYFYILKVPARKGKIPYDRLRNITFSIGEGLIFSEGTEIDEALVRVYKPRYFPKLMLFNSAVSMLKASVFDPAKTTLTLVDERGELASELHRLVPFASEIRVVTARSGRYEPVAEKLMDDYGLSLFIGDRFEKASAESTVIITYDCQWVPLSCKSLIFTVKPRFLPFARILVGQGVKGADGYAELCPEGIDKLTFVSALYEAAFQRKLHFAEYEKLVDTANLKD